MGCGYIKTTLSFMSWFKILLGTVVNEQAYELTILRNSLALLFIKYAF